MSEFTSNSLQILASSHQLDLAPYVSGSYNAQWNAPKILHGKHMLCSSRIFRKMGVEEPWLGLWLPLNYRVDMGAS